MRAIGAYATAISFGTCSFSSARRVMSSRSSGTRSDNVIYLALLRGINVGGYRKVAMSDLRDLLAQLGFADGRSVLQSGNLVFRSRARPPAVLEPLLETECEKRLGARTDFFVRTAKEWEAVVAKNPFPTDAKRDPGHLVAMFLKSAPGGARQGAAGRDHGSGDRPRRRQARLHRLSG